MEITSLDYTDEIINLIDKWKKEIKIKNKKHNKIKYYKTRLLWNSTSTITCCYDFCKSA